MINRIEAREHKLFGSNSLNIVINGHSIGSLLSAKTENSFYQNLYCSWMMRENNNPWEQHANYIWALLNNKQNCNHPILICPDDLDFWCTVVVTQVEYQKDVVIWHKIGVVTGAIDIQQWRVSGIQNLEQWSDIDWALYGDTLSGGGIENKTWDEWCSVNWIHEENRRLWNYFHPYFNDDKNIQWLYREECYFDNSDYDACVSAFKAFQS